MPDRAMRRMTIDAFLAWQATQEQRHELVDGEPVAMAGAKLRHDRVTGNAFSEIRRQLRANGSPCDAFTADIGIRTSAGNVRRPDVSLLGPPFYEQATTASDPRLIIEALSESTERVDRLIKLDQYKAIDTLEYIVIVDPTRVEVGCWSRDIARGWQSAILHESEDVVDMPTLGLAVNLAAVYERVQVTPRPRLKLIWEDGEGGDSAP